MRKIAFLFISILAIAFVIASPAMAQGPEPPFQEKGVLPDTLLQDPELGSLWKKYTRLLNSDKISLNDLQNMIASEKSEKAKLLGIVIREPSPSAQAQLAGFSLCIRPIWGPGKVIWKFPNPGQNGARYSVLPETASWLIWAQPPEQYIDGIYRANWGSCVAYKIPDSATATFYSADSWEVCYNAFACAVLGHCPKWVNPCDNNSPEGSWPDHPLW